MAIPARTARFLVIVLEAVRCIGMYHRSYSRLVYTHSKGIGADNHAQAAFFPGFLSFRSLVVRKPCMVNSAIDTQPVQPFTDLPCRLAAPAIDDAAAGY